MKDLDVLAAMQPQPLARHVFRQEYAATGEMTHLHAQQRVAHALAVDCAQELPQIRPVAMGLIYCR